MAIQFCRGIGAHIDDDLLAVALETFWRVGQRTGLRGTALRRLARHAIRLRCIDEIRRSRGRLGGARHEAFSRRAPAAAAAEVPGPDMDPLSALVDREECARLRAELRRVLAKLPVESTGQDCGISMTWPPSSLNAPTRPRVAPTVPTTLN